MVVGCVGTCYVLRVELPVQRRLCSTFVRDVGSPDIHECFRGFTGSQRTPGIWGVTLNKWRIHEKHIVTRKALQFLYNIHAIFFYNVAQWACRSYT